MRWQLPDIDKNLSNTISKELSCSLVLSDILVNRGFRDIKKIKDFLYPCLDDMYDPFLMKDMDKAVSRINQAMEKKEKVVKLQHINVENYENLYVT